VGGLGSSFGVPHVTRFLTGWSDRTTVLYRKQYPPPLWNSPKADWSKGPSCLPGSPPGCMDCYLGLVPRVRERAEFTRCMNAQKLTADLRIC
jgi:hypothetical protein